MFFVSCLRGAGVDTSDQSATRDDYAGIPNCVRLDAFTLWTGVQALVETFIRCGRANRRRCCRWEFENRGVAFRGVPRDASPLRLIPEGAAMLHLTWHADNRLLETVPPFRFKATVADNSLGTHQRTRPIETLFLRSA